MSRYFNISEYVIDDICDQFDLAIADDDGEVYERDELTYIDSSDIWVYDTYGYEFCNSCDRWVSDDHYNYDQDCCCDCAEDGIIKNYHDGHDDGIVFYDLCGESGVVSAHCPTAYEHIGIEWEVENLGCTQSELNEYAESVLSIIGYDFAHCERDCSLAGDGLHGFEIITQPFTIPAFKQFLQPRLIKAMEYMKEAGFQSHSGGRCGLHIHYGNDFFMNTSDGSFESWDARRKNQTRLVRFFNQNYNLLANLSRREYFEYCGKNSSDGYGGHYDAVNTSNSNTTEIRLGRGTLNADSFTAWVDLCNTIVRNIKTADCLRWDVMTNGITSKTREYIDAKTGNGGHATVSA